MIHKVNNMELNGKVKTGLGNANVWVNKINDIFEKKYGLKLFSGTLNIELDKPYILESNNIILPEEYGGEYKVFVKECTLYNIKAYILRPEINNKENGDHPLNIIEIVSNINFREKYNLKNGDNVVIKI